MKLEKSSFGCAAAVLSSGLLVLGMAQTAAAETTVSDINRIAVGEFQKDAPDFEAVAEFARRIVGEIGRHETDEDTLAHFYHQLGIVSLPRIGQLNAERWRDKDPTATIPVLAPMSGILAHLAGNLRQSLHQRVTWQATTDMRQNVKSLRGDLLARKHSLSHDPYWYILMVETMLGTGASAEEVAAVTEEGLARHPDNFELVTTATNRFLPKWGGDAEALEAWAAKMSDKFQAREGEAMYARIYWQALRAHYGETLFKTSKVDWSRLMQGLRDLITRQPSHEQLTRASMMACLGGNRALTREAMIHPKAGRDERYWISLNIPGGAYMPCRYWAAQTPTAPSTPTANP